MCLKKLREKFKDRKYLFLKPGKSNLTNYDKTVIAGFFFAHFGISFLAVMLTTAYWSHKTPEYKEMTARCSLMNEILEADARIDSNIEMKKAKAHMQGDSIDVKIEPAKKGRPLLNLLREYNQKFN